MTVFLIENLVAFIFGGLSFHTLRETHAGSTHPSEITILFDLHILVWAFAHELFEAAIVLLHVHPLEVVLILQFKVLSCNQAGDLAPLLTG